MTATILALELVPRHKRTGKPLAKLVLSCGHVCYEPTSVNRHAERRVGGTVYCQQPHPASATP